MNETIKKKYIFTIYDLNFMYVENVCPARCLKYK